MILFKDSNVFILGDPDPEYLRLGSGTKVAWKFSVWPVLKLTTKRLRVRLGQCCVEVPMGLFWGPILARVSCATS